jgi:hypothetical protein
MNRIPGLSTLLSPSIDMNGKQQKYGQGWADAAFNSMLSPSYVEKVSDNKVAMTVLDLYDETGSKDHFPRTAPRFITYNGKRYDLTPQQQIAMQREISEETVKGYEGFIKSNRYNQLSAEQKIQRMKAISTIIATKARHEILKQLIKKKAAL